MTSSAIRVRVGSLISSRLKTRVLVGVGSGGVAFGGDVAVGVGVSAGGAGEAVGTWTTAVAC